MKVSGAPLFARYVAIGDSSTEGLDDPDGRGHYRGWADRLARHLAAHAASRGAREPLLYANLGVRGRTTRQIREEQLEPALAMRPDIMTLFSGTNDVIRHGFDIVRVREDIDAMHRAIRATGATLLTFTLPDLAGVIPFARRIQPRVMALNAAIREVAAAHGSTLVDLAMHAVGSDPRLWSDDRLHANAIGHARIAAALAIAAGVRGDGIDEDWAAPLDPPAPPPLSVGGRVATELRWVRRHLLPWAWRHARGRSSGDGVTAKRPQLTPMDPREPESTRGPDVTTHVHSIHDIPVTAADGSTTTLAPWRGQVLLIVNVASQCGFTPQYAGLEAMHRKLAPRGFSVLGFPCNQFGEQEPGDAAEIASFCKLNYDVTFTLFGKIDVNGANAAPLYQWLKAERPGLLGTEGIKWNFTKFLIDREGRVVKRYAPTDTPESIERDVESVL